MNEPKIVAIIIGRSSSRCSACKREALLDHEKHRMDTLYGWSQRAGCGATFTHVTTDCTGNNIEAVSQNMRPDLPWIDYSKIPRNR